MTRVSHGIAQCLRSQNHEMTAEQFNDREAELQNYSQNRPLCAYHISFEPLDMTTASCVLGLRLGLEFH